MYIYAYNCIEKEVENKQKPSILFTSVVGSWEAGRDILICPVYLIQQKLFLY